jgi:hypothetical protein
MMRSVADFVSGLSLNADFYAQVVGPLLTGVPHAAARLGSGSEVLGFDTARSTDHGWGPRLVVFVDDNRVGSVGGMIGAGLPETFGGWPVRYGWDLEPVRHHVTVASLAGWLDEQLGVDATHELSAVDWLLMPQQKLLEVIRGAVYHDPSGELGRVRARLAWYPTPVWLWMLACQWHRIAQEEAFVGRAAEVGDELGSCLVAARLARELMRLWFLFERTYAPYTKWFGTAFRSLTESDALADAVRGILAAPDYPSREEALVSAYEVVARRHNAIGLPYAEPEVRPFYGRPYRVLMADRFADACLEQVDDARLRQLPLVGSIDQVGDSTDLLSDARRARTIAALYASRHPR